jgi:hypothetical protein
MREQKPRRKEVHHKGTKETKGKNHREDGEVREERQA